MMTIAQHTISDEVGRIAAAYPIKKAYLFGSCARGDADESSDIDVCIEPERGFTLFMLAGFGEELERALDRRVDVVCGEGSFYPHVRKSYANEKMLSWRIASTLS